MHKLLATKLYSNFSNYKCACAYAQIQIIIKKMLLISLAFENCVCVSAHFVLKSMRVKSRTQNAMFKRK